MIHFIDNLLVLCVYNLPKNLLTVFFLLSMLTIKPYKNKKYFIFISTFFMTMCSSFLDMLNVAGITQILVSLCIMLLIIKYWFMNVGIHEIIILIYSQVIYFLSKFVLTLTAPMIMTEYTKDIYTSQSFIFILNIIYGLLCYGSVKCRIDKKINILNPKFAQFLILEFMTILFLGEYVLNFLQSDNSQIEQSTVFIGVILIFTSIVYTLTQYSDFYEDYMSQKIQYEKEILQKQKDNMIKNMKYEIDMIDHRMNYVLQSVLNDIHNKDFAKVEKKIENLKDELNRITHTVDTQNEMFDLLLNFEIQNLHNNNTSIKTGIFISKNELYDDFTFCHSIVTLLQMSNNYFRNVELFMSEQEQKYVEVKLILNKCLNQDIEKYYQSFLNSLDYEYICFMEEDTLFILMKITMVKR